MRLKKDSSEQKLRGAYYTPLQLADAMVELFASQNISTVLEPSCGDGVFLEALQNLNLLNKVDKLTAVEIEPDEAEKMCIRDRVYIAGSPFGTHVFDLPLRCMDTYNLFTFLNHFRQLAF